MSDDTCGAQCKAELSCKYLGFGLASELTTDRSTDWQEAFGGKGAFGGNRTHLLIFKCFSAVLMTSILVWSIAGWVNSFAGEGKAASGLDPDGEDDDAYLPAHSGAGAFSYWPTKVTHWTLTVQVFYLWLSTYTTYKATEVTDVQLNSQSSMPFYVKLTVRYTPPPPRAPRGGGLLCCGKWFRLVSVVPSCGDTPCNLFCVCSLLGAGV
jgi:hypothetical protein